MKKRTLQLACIMMLWSITACAVHSHHSHPWWW